MKKYINLNKRLIIFVAGSVLSLVTGCKKLVDVEPPVTSITNETVFNSDAGAISVVTGLYRDISDVTSVFYSSVYLGLSSDEFTLMNGDRINSSYYQNSLFTTQSDGVGIEFWNTIYPGIYRINETIEGLGNSTNVTPAVKRQLLGESKFMRAFYYFTLTNLYGDVPLITGTDYSQNTLSPRSPREVVNKQIETDLLDAQNLLTENFVDGSLITLSDERIRPTKWAATALLARFYLYNQAWANAETQASTLITNTSLFELSSFDNSFLRAGLGNKEAIWQVQSTGLTGAYVPDATFIITNSAQLNLVTLSDTLLKSFEAGDQRKINWVGSVTFSNTTYYFPYKYKVLGFVTPAPEYMMIFRLAEQYLIRAEARAQLNKINGSNSAETDLNTIRLRAGLSSTPATTQIDMLAAIMHERQVELFSEQGHRWFDLKRTGLINTVMPGIAALKGGTWAPWKELLPIPYQDILADPHITQNSGY